MSPNPAALQDLAAALLKHYGSAGDIRALVEKAGGDVTEVELDGKPRNALYFALAYLYRSPERLLRLGTTVRTDGYWDAAVAALFLDLLLATAKDGTLRWRYDIALEEVARSLALVYPLTADCLTLGVRAGLPEAQLRAHVLWYGDDAEPTWCNLLAVTTLTQRFSALIGSVRADHPTNPAVQSLMLRLVPAREQATAPAPSSAQLRQGTAQQDAGAVPGGRSALAATRAQNPQAAPAADRRDPRASVRLAVQLSALDALENLRRLMDEALARFGREDAKDALATAQEGWQVTDFVDEVNRLADTIEGETLIFGVADPAAVLQTLHTLVATVLNGVRLAEAAEAYDAVADLTANAARAYESVARSIGGEQGELLGRVVPYWRMKATHARHEAKVLEQRRRLAAQPLPAAGQNRGGPTVPFGEPWS